MAYRIKIMQKGRPIRVFIKTNQGKLPSIIKLSVIKDKLLKYLQLYINAKRTRGIEEHPKVEGKGKWRIERYTQRNNLYNTIEASSKILEEKTPDGHYKQRLLLGNKTFLKQHAPYWRFLNYGGIPPTTIGYFGKGYPPKGGGRDVFHYTGNYGGRPVKSFKNFLMVPKKPVTGIHYLEEMAKVFEIELALIRQEFLRNR